jgi:ketosteroid isomerase-like protein
MKNLLLSIWLLCIIAFTGNAQPTSAGEEQNIQQTIINLFEGFSAFDTNQIISYCTKDVKILEDGVIWNADSLRLKISQGKSRNIKRVNTITFVQTQVQGKVAWTTYHNQANITVNGKQVTRKWLESAVLIKEGKEWKVSLLHSTVIEQPKN